jgi:hypothetical protein
MHDLLYQSVGTFSAGEQLALSLRAAKATEFQKAARERNRELKAQRKHSRAARRGQEAYTTAV